MRSLLKKRVRKHHKIRTAIRTSETRPRLSLYKSNTRIFAQIIDDRVGKTLVSVSSGGSGKESGGKKSGSAFPKVNAARAAGETLAKEAIAKKITKVAFDRGGFKYAGRVKAFAEGARAGGLNF